MISIIVTERERLGVARASFRSVLGNLEGASEVVYVVGKAPASLLPHLRKAARGKVRFKPILDDRPLVGNPARLAGWGAARKGNDLVFLQNDVIVRKGWLSRMVLCAQRTGAGVVAPLVLEGRGGKKDLGVHDAGAKFVEGEGGAKRLVHLFHRKELQGRRLDRQAVDVVELHCLLVKAKVMGKGLLDGRLGDLSAHLDLSMECRERGIEMMMEPRAQVVFMNPQVELDLDEADLERFLGVWEEPVCRREMAWMSEKWGIPPRAHYFWEKRAWAVLYKAAVFGSKGVLGRAASFLWRSTRTRWCPEWFRTLTERAMVARVLDALGKEGGRDG